MSESRRRAAITSRTNAPDSWDAGLHGESDAGPIDVGLSIEPSAVGVIVDAPGVGLLKVAFDVDADGTTKLARATRRLADGREAPLVVIDEQQVLRLEGELQRARADFDTQIGTLTTERDEARDRAGILHEEKQKHADRREELEKRLAIVSSELQSEKDAQLQLINEREMLREELEAAKEELESASGQARGAEAQHQSELDWISSELKKKNEELAAANEKAGSVDEEATRVTAELEALRSEIESLKSELDTRTMELEEARAQVESLSQEKSKLEQELDRLTHEHEQLTKKHDSLTKELQVSRELTAEAEGKLQAIAENSEDSNREAQDRLQEELAQLTAQLDDRQRELDDARAQLQVANEELATRESQHAEAESKLSAVEAALAEANARHEEERGRYTTSESMVTAERNDARARITALDEQVEEATRSGSLALATERAERERLEQELEDLRAQLEGEKAARNSTLDEQVQEAMRAGEAALATERAERERVEQELESVRAQLDSRSTTLDEEPSRTDETALAAERAERERVEMELEELRAQVASEQAATAEARNAATKLLAERDEARGIARQLNAKVNTTKTALKELETLKVERDQWQRRFSAMASAVPNDPASSQDETREYQIESPTDPNVPAVSPNKKDT